MTTHATLPRKVATSLFAAVFALSMAPAASFALPADDSETQSDRAGARVEGVEEEASVADEPEDADSVEGGALAVQAASPSSASSAASASAASAESAASESVVASPRLMWANDTEDAEKWFDDADAAIVNGTVELIGVEFTDASGSEQALDADDLSGNSASDEAYFVDGTLGAPEDATVTVKIMPDFGYQLTSDEINDGDITLSAQDDEGVYTFSMLGEDAYLDVDFEAAEDIVVSNSPDIASGSITRGDDDALDNGTLRLTVDELTDEEAKAELDENASKGKIVAYMDLTMESIVNQADEDSAWAEQVSTLNNAVTINLVLGDDVANDDAKSYYVLREHDGEFQQAPADYDADTKTVSFKSNAFSNYAIVEGTTDSSTSSSSASKSSSSSSTSTASSSSSKTTPAAGDETGVLPLGALAFGAAAAAVSAARRMRADGAE